ncbi:Rod Cgmp-Specific 3',5'-Cyclic Phosphodiesterase Subunit Alpha [Manis pentadactyla]|nr:Rod Cgmp-Specific 3',5'-Cyclic Phosphodiesterase Subunit Alpha [Manis pentadactyla]
MAQAISRSLCREPCDDCGPFTSTIILVEYCGKQIGKSSWSNGKSFQVIPASLNKLGSSHQVQDRSECMWKERSIARQGVQCLDRLSKKSKMSQQDGDRAKRQGAWPFVVLLLGCITSHQTSLKPNQDAVGAGQHVRLH